MKRFLIILMFLVMSISTYASNPSYSLKKDYKDQSQLYNTLVTEGFKSSDKLFLWCCDCIEFYSKMFGISYSTLNLIIFVIIGPSITFLLFLICIIQRFRILYLKRTLAG